MPPRLAPGPALYLGAALGKGERGIACPGGCPSPLCGRELSGGRGGKRGQSVREGRGAKEGAPEPGVSGGSAARGRGAELGAPAPRQLLPGRRAAVLETGGK